MSDTDDTDFLLFIPPNFFSVSSPECVSPDDHLLFTERKVTIDGRESIHHTMDTLNTLKNIDIDYPSTPLLNKVNGIDSPTLHTAKIEHNGSLSVNASELSCFENKNEKPETTSCNTWPIKTNDYINVIRKEVKHPSDNNDLFHANNKLIGKSTMKNTFSKFNISQVDQLLMEMEKTRAEIKNKLQSNKNKIYEMRRECLGNDTGVNVNRDKNNFKIPLETIRNYEAVKHAADITNKTDLISNSKNETRSLINSDFNFPLLSGSKNILQLSQILSTENNTETLQQKLEAEILKKKHCEEIIQELQLKILDQQQNLNVAQKIDADKEEIIKQLQSAWLQLVEHWKELEHQRQELALMLEQERVEARNMNLNFTQKIETLETRLHETISLASGYRGRNEELEKSLKQMQQSLTEFNDNLKKSEEDMKLMELEKSNLLEEFRQINEGLTSEKQKNFLLQNNISNLESQISTLISEKNDLTTSLREERSLVFNLKSEMIKLKEDYFRISNAESLASQQISTMKQEILKAKNNLKEFYQNQLDTLLRKKIEEFQNEFQKTQAVMKKEFNEQERIAEERLQSELKQLQNSHKVELAEERRVNQKHVNILKAELRESRKKIYELENRLKSDSSSKAELARRVQSVLKSQWLEALNVISANDDLSKEFFSSSKNADEHHRLEKDEESSELEIFSNKSQKVPFDLRNYVSKLLEKEPGNPVDEYKNLEFALSGYKTELYDRKSEEVPKSSDGYRKKPPWK